VLTNPLKNEKLPTVLNVILRGYLYFTSFPRSRVGMHISKFGKKRIAGLNKGEIWTSEDFDKPLSDAFWLGEK
jgi:hypothetical protein